jgi:hypothetical protein
MSSNCPPQLHLSLPSNVTSFKRSFEQFGFDLESPTIVGSTDLGGSVSSQSTSSGSDGNERNKRARSASSASHSSGTMEHHPQSPLPLITSPASNSAISVIENGVSEGSGLATTRPPTLTLNTHRYAYPTQTPSFLEPLRLPTPEMQDIVMSGFPSATIRRSSSPGSPPLTTSGHDIQYRISLERFNTFDSHISALRQSRSPALRLPTPPPILPPLALASDTGDRNGLHAMPTSASSVLASPPEALLPRSLYNINLPSDSRSQMSDRDNRVENYESRLAGRVWPPGSPNSTLGSRGD